MLLTSFFSLKFKSHFSSFLRKKMDLKIRFAIYQLCDLQEVINHSVPQFHILQNEDNISILLYGIMVGIK